MLGGGCQLAARFWLRPNTELAPHLRFGMIERIVLLLEKSLHYSANARRLFELLVTKDNVRRWTGAEVEIEPEPWGRDSDAARGLARGLRADTGSPHVRAAGRAIHDDTTEGSRLELRETGFAHDDDLPRRRDWLWSHWLVRLSAMPG
jgi:hypothetical protein